MLRVWGGGFYEEERFYDLCDRYGILVWQEFIFSCSIYPLDDPAFVENVHVEAVENIRRLRHRASLALWCGNNEMERGWYRDWKQPELQEMKEAYNRFFFHTLREWCTAEIRIIRIGPVPHRRRLHSRTPIAKNRGMPTIGMSGMAASRSLLTAINIHVL